MKQYDSRRILSVPVEDVAPNPMQPRRSFDEDELAALADSIAQFGILQPLTVRRVARGYELIAGERRLRAARRAGLRCVPCILTDVAAEDSALLALIENLQRRDLDYLEEAEALAKLIKTYGLTQEELARRVSRSQSAIANKLRLLKLSPEVVFILRRAKLSERHARALLRLPVELRVRVAEVFAEQHLNVADAERCVDEILLRQAEAEQTQPVPPPAEQPGKKAGRKRTPARQAPKYYIKDVRIFMNSLTRNLELMRSSGVSADCTEAETDSEYVVTIKIPKSLPSEA